MLRFFRDLVTPAPLPPPLAEQPPPSKSERVEVSRPDPDTRWAVIRKLQGAPTRGYGYDTVVKDGFDNPTAAYEEASRRIAKHGAKANRFQHFTGNRTEYQVVTYTKR